MRVLTALLSLLASVAVGTQPRPFTADDALQVTSVAVLDLTADGRWIAATTAARAASLGVDYRRDGDPSYVRPGSATLWVIDATTGERRAVFAEPRNVRGAAWSPSGAQLAVVVASGQSLQAVVWDRASGQSRPLQLPSGRMVAENSDVRWSADSRKVIVSLRGAPWRDRVAGEFKRLTQGPVFVQDSRDPFLAWDGLRRLGNVRSLVSIDVASGTARDLVPEGNISSFTLSADDSLVTYQEDITPRTDYDVIFGTENRLMMRRAGGGEARALHASLKGMTLAWAEDGRQYAYAREGRVFVTRVDASTPPRFLAGPDTGRTAEADTTAAARQARARARFGIARWSPRGDALLLTNSEGFWVANAATGERTLVLASDTLPTSPRHTPVGWSPDGQHLYFSYASRTQWERGLVRVHTTTRQREELVRDGRLYQGFRLSKDGSRLLYTASDGNRPGDLYVADARAGTPRQLTTANPQIASLAMARTRLISYHDVDGRTRHGVAYLPANYQPDRKYPTLFNVYEDFFDDTFDATVNVLTSAGYVVVKPSVAFETGFPGEAWLKGVTGAANALVQQGIADSSRLGVFGTSYGGYATNLLITQTPRFKAAVNISGKVDIISFYTDSPRLGVRNIHAAEKSQDRIGATLWQQPQKYVAHSAVMFADRITTPLMLVTGEQDSNVPAGNSREMYYALRRLGTDVSWVNYMDGGHGIPGTNAAEYIDFHERLVAFFDEHLKPPPAAVVEATSLAGEPLYRNVPTGATARRMGEQLADARRAWRNAPENADSIIWYGRRTAYPGRFNDAIGIFTAGITKFPNDARFYRHRGHRYLSVRNIDAAIADFEKAATLVRGRKDEVEPDGAPNARGIPTSTLQSNIWYHLGLAYYLKGDFTNALRAYREDMKVSTNPDMLVATSHWLYMTLRRLGRTAEAARVLDPISADMEIIENGSYHRLLLMYKGLLKPEEVLKDFGAQGGLDDVTTAYGVGNWHLYNGRAAEAEAIFTRIVGAKGQWASFGYLSAEAEKRRNVADR